MNPSGKVLNSFHVSSFCALIGMLAGCGQVGYYWQAGKGQVEVWSETKPVAAWLEDSALPARLRDRLHQSEVIRRFASQALSLPDNGSYRSYADLKRQAVVWNVFAARPDSIDAHQWCFPVAGCVPYRGYYQRDDAVAFAAEMEREGLETYVGPVTAYSTLGWFDDPLLNTFIHNGDADLARLIFHELAHQLIYVPGDAEFNEGFASAVESIGVDTWLTRHGDAIQRAEWDKARQQRLAMQALLLQHRDALKALYATPGLPAAQRRERRTLLTDALRARFLAVRDGQGMDSRYDRFFAGPLNNAQLASFTVYSRWDGAFQKLFADSGSLPAFYGRVSALALVEATSRSAQLDALAVAALPAGLPADLPSGMSAGLSAPVSSSPSPARP